MFVGECKFELRGGDWSTSGADGCHRTQARKDSPQHRRVDLVMTLVGAVLLDRVPVVVRLAAQRSSVVVGNCSLITVVSRPCVSSTNRCCTCTKQFNKNRAWNHEECQGRAHEQVTKRSSLGCLQLWQLLESTKASNGADSYKLEGCEPPCSPGG